MRPRYRWSLLAAGWLLALGAATIHADEPPPWHPWRLREWPGRAYYGRGGGEHTFDRAGHPEQISHFAYFSNTCRYYGYYVGGGVVGHGRGPAGISEGTWGWDYGGLLCFVPKLIELKWNDNRYQGGTGRYKIDGPPVKDVGPYIEKLKEGPGAIHKSHGGEEEHE
jgi:hypothetical protein